MKEDVQNTFLRQQPDSTDETVEKGHGRLETRKYEVINKLDFLDEKEQWAGLKTIARVTATREINGKQTSEKRLYISSVELRERIPRSSAARVSEHNKNKQSIDD